MKIHHSALAAMRCIAGAGGLGFCEGYQTQEA